MKVTFYTQTPVSFHGINDVIRKTQEQIQKKFPTVEQDSFTPSQNGEQTIIIEHYYENGQNKDNTSNLYSQTKSGGAAAEGAVSGVTAGGAIEGTKAFAQKVKGAKSEAATDDSKSVDTDTNAEVDLSDSPDKAETEDLNIEKNDIDDSVDNVEDVDKDIEPELDDIDPELDPDIDVDPDIDIDIDIDPEIDIEPELDIEL